MTRPDERDRQIAALRERLSKLTEASLRINESLDLDEVLQSVLDSARTLTDARYAAITTLDDSGQMEDFQVSGLTVEEDRHPWEIPGGHRFFEYLSAIPGPLRVADLAGHTRAIGLTEFHLPVQVSSFLAVPIRHQGVSVGNIHVAKGELGEEFSREDEETLVMFASQVALVVANARRHRDERRAKIGLETLIDTSPMGVVVFDMRNGAPVSFNREARRIVDGLRNPDQTPEQLLDVMTVRRADGSEISLLEFPLAEALSTGETVRAEEIVMAIPDGRSINVLLNATPIRSEESEVESVVVTMQDLTPLEEMERLRAEFLGMVSHELRIPLTFEAGAVDYIVKPFSPTELVARVRAALRRGAGPYHAVPSEPYVLGDLTIDYAERLVTLAGRPVELRAKEYQLLYELSVNAGRVVTHDELLRRIWGPKRPDDLRALRTHLRRLRQKLGEDASNPTYFFAEPRVGYRMAKGEGWRVKKL